MLPASIELVSWTLMLYWIDLILMECRILLHLSVLANVKKLLCYSPCASCGHQVQNSQLHTKPNNQPHTTAHVHRTSYAICSWTIVYIASACWQIERGGCNTTVYHQGHVRPGVALLQPWSKSTYLSTQKKPRNHEKFLVFSDTGQFKLFWHNVGPKPMGFCQCALS